MTLDPAESPAFPRRRLRSSQPGAGNTNRPITAQPRILSSPATPAPGAYSKAKKNARGRAKVGSLIHLGSWLASFFAVGLLKPTEVGGYNPPASVRSTGIAAEIRKTSPTTTTQVCVFKMLEAAFTLLSHRWLTGDGVELRYIR